VVVTVALPNSVTFTAFGSVPAGGATSYNAGTSTLSWTLPTLAPGAYLMTYQVQVNSPVACGSNLADTAQMTYPGQASVQSATANVILSCSTPTFTPTVTLTPGTQPISTPICYPNPSDGTVPIQLQVNLGKPADLVKIEIFTTAFRKVREMPISNVPTGVLQTSVELKDNWGAPLASGLYYLVVTNGSDRAVGKILILR
jgi:hypothetical protein